MSIESEGTMNSAPTTSEHVELNQEVITVIDPKKVSAIWQDIVKNPDEWLVDLLEGETEQKVAFVAGGGLPLFYGTDNDLWNNMLKSMDDEHLTINNVTFTKSELMELGFFYRYLRDEEIVLHCIDERCVDDLNNTGSQVHEHCGACAAVGASIFEKLGIDMDVEGFLQKELNPNAAKQPIHPEMQAHHASMAILIDLSGADIVNQASRETLRAEHALPFNVSLPLDLIQAYIDRFTSAEAESHERKVTLVSALVKWNVQMASNIIGGDHNRLQEHANKTVLVIDRRDISASSDDLRKMFVEASEMVDHGEVLTITDPDPAA